MTPTLAHTDERRPPPTRQCRHPDCDAWGSAETFPTDDYCSEACKDRHAGRDLLDDIVHDHRYCGHCGTKLKVVYRPERGVGLTRKSKRWKRERPPERFVGYQSTLPDAAAGERERRAEGIVPPVVETGIVCGACGATDLADPVPWTDHDHLIEAAGLFCDALAREGVAAVDYEAVLYAVVETGDLELAIGRGCET